MRELRHALLRGHPIVASDEIECCEAEWNRTVKPVTTFE
jgi:hypothetical protein